MGAPRPDGQHDLIIMGGGIGGIISLKYAKAAGLDAPNLFILAPGVLETITSTPWAYAHVAKSIMSHISGQPVFDSVPMRSHENYFDLVRFLARRDRANYPFAGWYLKYLNLAFRRPGDRPMPIP